MACFLCAVIAFIVVFLLLRYLLGLISVKNLSSKAVFITGCDTGFGPLLALKCAKMGMTVFAGCLTAQGENSLKEKSNEEKTMIMTVHIDITKEETVKKAVKFVEANLTDGIEFWALVNNAGVFSVHGFDDWCSIEDYQRSLDVNTLGHIRVTHAFKPLLKRSKGRIVTVTSTFGLLVYPGYAAYSMAKFATESYMNALRQELLPFGIKCCIVAPGGFHTNLVNEDAMRERINASFNKLPDEEKSAYGEDYKDKYIAFMNRATHAYSSTNFDDVVNSYVHAITSRYPRYRYTCGWDAHLLHVPLSHLPPEISDFVTRLLYAMLKQPALPLSDKKSN